MVANNELHDLAQRTTRLEDNLAAISESVKNLSVGAERQWKAISEVQSGQQEILGAIKGSRGRVDIQTLGSVGAMIVAGAIGFLGYFVAPIRQDLTYQSSRFVEHRTEDREDRKELNARIKEIEVALQAGKIDRLQNQVQQQGQIDLALRIIEELKTKR